MRRVVLSMLGLALTVGMIGCGGDTAPAPAPAEPSTTTAPEGGETPATEPAEEAK